MKTKLISRCVVAAAVSIVFVPRVVCAQGVTGTNFNPALSVIVDGKYAHYSRDPNDYAVSGFILGDEAGIAPKGFSLGESEIAASANVDDKFFGQVTLALESLDDKTEVHLEEAFVQTTALPSGFTAKAGRFFSDIGYQNSRHAHAWDFVDQPLAYKVILGNQYGDDGIHAKWVAPTDLLIEVGAEAFRGAAFPASGATHGGIGSWTAFAHAGGDLNAEQSWRAGLSYLHAGADSRESSIGANDAVTFSGTSRVWIADFVWKWAANGNVRSRNLVVQGEFLRREEAGTVANAVSDAPFDGTAGGFYLQAVYQFKPRWRTGVRYDRLSFDNRGAVLSASTPLNDADRDPTRITAMVDFSNSEFSRLRLQVADDRSRPERDTQVTLQYLMSIGAHGAHQF